MMIEFLDLMLNDKDYFLENLPGVFLFLFTALCLFVVARGIWIEIKDF